MDVLCLTALRDCPDRLDEAACWFHEKWGIPAEVYRDSIRQGIRQKAGIPQWYIVQKEEGEIVAGVGLIDHDYHSRRDLTPNVCALYASGPCEKGSGGDGDRNPLSGYGSYRIL